MEIILDDNKYPVEIIRKNNLNTYIRVKEGTIYVTTNKFCTNNKIIKLIEDNEKSIIKMIEHDNKKIEKKDKFYYFGKEHDVIYGFTDTELTDNKLYIKDKKTLDKFIKDNILKIYSERLEYWYNKFTEHIPRPTLRIRKMTSRWGVCNTKTHYITLNYFLINYDIECLDYVIVHELSHLIHPNHSKQFWSIVEKYYPNYKECRKKLKD